MREQARIQSMNQEQHQFGHSSNNAAASAVAAPVVAAPPPPPAANLTNQAGDASIAQTNSIQAAQQKSINGVLSANSGDNSLDNSNKKSILGA